MQKENASKAAAASSGLARLAAFGRAFESSGKSGEVDRPFSGVIFVFAAMGFLAALITMGRYAALEGINPSQVVFFRNFFCVIWMLPLFAWRGMSLVRTQSLHLYGLRVGLSFIAMTAMFHAVGMIPVGEVTAISFLSPLFGTAFAIGLLGERVGIRRWMAIVVGFVGAMIILRPSGGDFNAGQMAALVSACAVGVIGPLVKRLTREDDADRVVFLTNLLLTPLSFVPAVFVWTWPTLEMWGLFLVMGLIAVLGHMSLVRAYAAMDASLVMTFKFVRLPFAVLFGFLVFREAIDGMTWVGGFIIFAASAYVTHREARFKAAKPPIQPPM